MDNKIVEQKATDYRNQFLVDSDKINAKECFYDGYIQCLKDNTEQHDELMNALQLLVKLDQKNYGNQFADGWFKAINQATTVLLKYKSL